MESSYIIFKRERDTTHIFNILWQDWVVFFWSFFFLLKQQFFLLLFLLEIDSVWGTNLEFSPCMRRSPVDRSQGHMTGAPSLGQFRWHPERRAHRQTRVTSRFTHHSRGIRCVTKQLGEFSSKSIGIHKIKMFEHRVRGGILHTCRTS